MMLPRLQRSRSRPPDEAAAPIDARELARMFAAPTWLQDLGLVAWFLVGVGVVLVGLVWLLDEIATIVLPLVAGTVVASVAGPGVSSLQRRGVPRALGAAIVLLALLALAVLVFLLVLNGIVANGDEIRTLAAQAADKVGDWLGDGGPSAAEETKQTVPAMGETLLEGVADGISGLTSLAFFMSFTIFSTFFLLKDGPNIRGFIERHLGVPDKVARVVTSNVLTSLRRYFFGVSIVAAFNGVVVALGALALDVPLAATIGVVTFVTAFVPFIGAVVSGAFAVIIALASEGTEVAAVMLVVVLLANGMLQNVVQPVAFGATLELNPLAVLVVTIAAGSLFGMIGMVLAAPLASAGVHISRELAAARAGVVPEDENAPEGSPVAAPT